MTPKYLLTVKTTTNGTRTYAVDEFTLNKEAGSISGTFNNGKKFSYGYFESSVLYIAISYYKNNAIYFAYSKKEK